MSSGESAELPAPLPPGRYTVDQDIYASDDGWSTVFAPGAFDGQIGKTVPVVLDGQREPVGTCQIVGVDIAPGGHVATLHIELRMGGA